MHAFPNLGWSRGSVSVLQVQAMRSILGRGNRGRALHQVIVRRGVRRLGVSAAASIGLVVAHHQYAKRKAPTTREEADSRPQSSEVRLFQLVRSMLSVGLSSPEDEAVLEQQIMDDAPLLPGTDFSRKSVVLDEAAAVRMLHTDGVVKITDCLSAQVTRTLLAHINTSLIEAQAALSSGEGGEHPPDKPSLRFGNVRCPTSRYDLKLRLESPVVDALKEALLPLKKVCAAVLGADAELFELAALVADPGAPRQQIHPDSIHHEGGALVISFFIALQETNESMGPTVFLPGTHHNPAAHADLGRLSFPMFEGGEPAPPAPSARERFLQTAPRRLGLLSTGDAMLFDSRTLHCGSANESSRRRVLFYFSFKAKGAVVPGVSGTLDAELRHAQLLLDDSQAWLGGT